MSTMNDALAALAGVTDNERNFLQALVEGLYAEPGFSDVTVDECAKRMGVAVKSAKGILGSLVKKGFAWTDRADTDAGHFDLIYLSEKHYDLHDKWSAQTAERAAEDAAKAAAGAPPVPFVTGEWKVLPVSEFVAACNPDPGMVATSESFAQAIIDGDHGAAVKALAAAGIPDASVPVLTDWYFTKLPDDEPEPDEPTPDWSGTGAYVYKVVPIDAIPAPIESSPVSTGVAIDFGSFPGDESVAGECEACAPSAGVAEVITIADELNALGWTEPQVAMALVNLAKYRVLTEAEADFLVGALTAKAAKPAPKSACAAKARDPRLPPAGTVIERTFKGQVYAVKTTVGNAVIPVTGWGIDAHFASLSGAAKSVTGHETNGFAFWLAPKK